MPRPLRCCHNGCSSADAPASCKSDRIRISFETYISGQLTLFLRSQQEVCTDAIPELLVKALDVNPRFRMSIKIVSECWTPEIWLGPGLHTPRISLNTSERTSLTMLCVLRHAPETARRLSRPCPSRSWSASRPQDGCGVACLTQQRPGDSAVSPGPYLKKPSILCQNGILRGNKQCNLSRTPDSGGGHSNRGFSFSMPSPV